MLAIHASMSRRRTLTRGFQARRSLNPYQGKSALNDATPLSNCSA
jgi:hypothetical protein